MTRVATSLPSRPLLGGIDSGLTVLALRTLAVALAFSLSALLGRVLGPEGYGLYATVIAAVAVIGIPAQLGVPTLVLRETARARAADDLHAIPALWRWGRRATLATSAALCLTGSLIGHVFLQPSSPAYALPYSLGLLLIPLVAMTNLHGSIVQGLGRPALGQAADTTIRPAAAILIVAIPCLIAGGTLTPTGAVGAAVAASACALAFSVIAYRRNRPLPSIVPPQIDAQMRADWLKAALPLGLVAAMQVINQQTSPLLLSLLASGREAGIYRAVTQLGAVLVFAQTAVAMGLAHRIAALHQSGARAELQALATAAARLSLLVALPGALAFIVFGDEILSLIFGPAFAAGAGPLAILALGQLFNAGCGLVVSLLNMTGHARHAAWGMAVAAGSNLALHFALVPSFGMTGAAIASATSIVLWNLALTYSVFRTLGVVSTATPWRPRR